MIEIALLLIALCDTESLTIQISLFIRWQEPQTVIQTYYSIRAKQKRWKYKVVSNWSELDIAETVVEIKTILMPWVAVLMSNTV